MKEFRFKIILIIAALALSVYLLWPTYKDYRNTKEINEVVQKERVELKESYPEITKQDLNRKLVAIEDSLRTADPSILETRQKRIKLGLDLQGGMRVVLEVNTAKLMEKLAKNPDDVFKSVLSEAEKEAALSNESVVDIIGRKFEQRQIRLSRYFGTIREDDEEILSSLKEDAEDAVNRAIEIIRNRVDQYGVSEPSIQRQGSRRVIVELPGVAKEEEAKNLLQGTALLEFKILKDPEFTISLMQKIDNALAGKTLEDTTKVEAAENKKEESKDTSLIAVDSASENQQLSEEEFKKEHPFFAIAMLDPQGQSADAYVRESQKALLSQYLNREEIKKIMPNNVEFIYSAKPIGFDKGENIYMMYLVNKNAELTGGVITDAQANIDPNTSSPIVSMEMNSEGATEWARITGANVGKRIAIVLDGVAFSSPVVRNKITGGRSQIEGMANMEEAKLLEIVLKAGALPAPVDIIEERTVGPSLGQDSVNSGLSASIIGYIAVGFFMILYYQKSGTIAAAGLVFSIMFILAVLAGFGATLTLPGIAGIILTMGMAVDANVLIFERIREEMETGKTIKASIDSGFSKSYSAIFDSNITTFFTGIILYQFGTGPVQGFALTLMIGIVTSLFSALFISRLIFDMLVARNSKISIG